MNSMLCCFRRARLATLLSPSPKPFVHYSTLVNPPSDSKLREQLYKEFRISRSKSIKNVVDGYIQRMITQYNPDKCFTTYTEKQHTLLQDQRVHEFEIVESPGKQKITLKRELSDGAKIQILVDICDDTDEAIIMCRQQFDISLVVDIERDQRHLVLDCKAPPFQIVGKDEKTVEMDENIHDYIIKEIGIRSSLVDFLREYMFNKYKRDYFTWLSAVKAYVVELNREIST